MQTNRFELSGFLATKPETRNLPSGTLVASVRLGQTQHYQTKEGTKKRTNWFSLVFYGELASIAIDYDKGDNLSLVGTIEQRQFTPKDGSTRTVYEVIVQRCHLVERLRTTPTSQLSHKSITESLAINDLPEQSPNGEETDDSWALL